MYSPAPLGVGRFRVGPVALEIEIESHGPVANVRARVSNVSDREVGLDSVT